MRTLVKIFLVILLATSAIVAQDLPAGPHSKSQEAILEDLLRRVADLESKLEAANQKLAGSDTSARPAVLPPVAMPELVPASAIVPIGQAPADAHVPPPDQPGPSAHSLGVLQLRGFSDISFGRPVFNHPPDTSIASAPNSFGVGDFDLFATARLSDRLSFLGEMLVTSDFENHFSVEMDRLLLSFKLSDYFNASFGKFNTAIGYYTSAYHRARYFQVATERPVMFGDEDDGGILPVHSIGLTVTGHIPSGKLGLHYAAEIANGRTSQNFAHHPTQNFSDENASKAVNIAVYSRPEWVHGLQTGISLYRDRLYPESGSSISESIAAAHLVYVTPRIAIMNEVAMVRHRDSATGQTTRSVTGYTEVSRVFRGWRPYFRYDYQNVGLGDDFYRLLAENDPVFRNGRRNGSTFGIHYQLAEFAGIKLQYGRLFETGRGSVNDFQLQFAFAF